MYSKRRSSFGFLKPYHLRSAAKLLVVVEEVVGVAAALADVVLVLLGLLLAERRVVQAEVVALLLDRVYESLVGGEDLLEDLFVELVARDVWMVDLGWVSGGLPFFMKAFFMAFASALASTSRIS